MCSHQDHSEHFHNPSGGRAECAALEHSCLWPDIRIGRKGTEYSGVQLYNVV